MDIIKLYRSRKYLLRILLSICLLMAVFLIISSVLQYYNFKRTVLENQQTMNRKVLNQVNYNIDYMSELVKTLSLSLYFDSDIVSLMNSRTIDIFELYPKLNRLGKVANTTTFIQSIMVYNSYNGCYYSTNVTTSCKDDGMNQVLDGFLNDNERLPKLRFVPMSLNRSNELEKPVDLFSYFMYESTDNLYHKQSTFIVNLKPEWLFDNVDAINNLSEQSDSYILIMDSSGTIFNPTASQLPDQGLLRAGIKNHLAKSNKTIDFFIDGAGSNKKYITYMNSTANNWIVVNVQNYQSVFGKVDKMRTNSIVMIVGFLILSMLVSVVLSLKLYKPIENMLKLIKKTSSQEIGRISLVTDEFSYISSEYKLATENMAMLLKNHEAQINIMKTYYLRKLITDSSIVSLRELQDEIGQSGLKVDLNRIMLLGVLKFDNYPQYSKDADVFEKKLHKFAIANIAQEVLSARFVENEIVDMRNDHFVVLVNVEEPTDEIYSELIALLKDVQLNVLKYYRISLTVSLSEPVRSFHEITKYYGQAMEYSFYRLVYGKMAVITTDMVRANQSNTEFHFSPDMERRLLESIRSNDLKQVKEVLQHLMTYISKLNYQNITFSLQHLVVIINNVIREINSGNVNQISVDLQHFYNLMMEQETLEGTHLLFTDLLMEISEKRNHVQEDSRNYIIVDTIKQIIEENYADLNLNLQGIAAMMKLSTTHISKLFKSRESISVTDFITEVRLSHSLKLLENNRYTINEIVELVGFGNQSYFFKLFKKRFGTTPKEYRIKKVIQ